MGAGLWLAIAGVPLCAAQEGAVFGPDKAPAVVKERMLPNHLPDKPSLPPALSIPVGTLGFSAPGPIYLGQRFSMASLDFLDENRLLFTFRVPGLLHREAGSDAESDEHQVRAVVLVLPAGTVEAEALWTLHDRAPYLWVLKDGHFLLRDRDGLQQGDATLELKPFLHFPGPLLWMEMDPMQRFLATSSREPVTPKPGQASGSAAADADGQKPSDPSDMVVRILQRESGQVMLVSRSRAVVHLPINSDGYIENLRSTDEQWVLNLNYFGGGSRVLGHVDSTCAPKVDFLSQRELLAAACVPDGGRKLVAMATDGRRLWQDQTSAEAIWPLLVRSPDGSRLAWETLVANHAINAYAPLYREDVKGQLVRIFDAANGNVALEAPASPALDAGGNVAISPSGRRVALLNDGSIQVFDLPAPPALPAVSVTPPAQ
jgi:hypothetical protein